ncbi:hypothetical protein GGX14DRAFT_309948, partial [Mycena pura]
LDFRHYLRVRQPEHRKALTKTILLSHSLAVERRRWKERAAVAKTSCPASGDCRFCYIYVEDPAHAMFRCEHAELVPIRQVF